MAIGLTATFYATDFHMAGLARNGAEFWSPKLTWDEKVPFRPRWIWVYLLYFPLCFLPLSFRELRHNMDVFRRTAIGFLVQFGTAFTAFLLMPSRMVQPAISGISLSERAVALVYQLDPGFNVFPSLHVTNAAFVACLIWRLKGSGPGAAAWVTTILITASTLFVKQHYILDLPAGMLLGTACYLLAFSRRSSPHEFEADRRAAQGSRSSHRNRTEVIP